MRWLIFIVIIGLQGCGLFNHRPGPLFTRKDDRLSIQIRPNQLVTDTFYVRSDSFYYQHTDTTNLSVTPKPIPSYIAYRNGDTIVSVVILPGDTTIILDTFNLKFRAHDSAFLEIFRQRFITAQVFRVFPCEPKFVDNFKEWPNTRERTRRIFEFQVHYTGFESCTSDSCGCGMVFFELRNRDADKRTDLKTFISGAELMRLHMTYNGR